MVFKRIVSSTLIFFLLILSSGVYVFKHICYSSGEVVISLIEEKATCNHDGNAQNCHLPASGHLVSCCKTNSHCHFDRMSCCKTFFQYIKVKTEYESGKKLLIRYLPEIVISYFMEFPQSVVNEEVTSLFEFKQKIPDAGKRLVLLLHQSKIPFPDFS